MSPALIRSVDVNDNIREPGMCALLLSSTRNGLGWDAERQPEE